MAHAWYWKRIETIAIALSVYLLSILLEVNFGHLALRNGLQERKKERKKKRKCDTNRRIFRPYMSLKSTELKKRRIMRLSEDARKLKVKKWEMRNYFGTHLAS